MKGYNMTKRMAKQFEQLGLTHLCTSGLDTLLEPYHGKYVVQVTLTRFTYKASILVDGKAVASTEVVTSKPSSLVQNVGELLYLTNLESTVKEIDNSVLT